MVNITSTKSCPYISPPVYKPPFTNEYKLRAYIRSFTVYACMEPDIGSGFYSNVFIHLPLIHFTPPPRLLIEFKYRK